MFMQNEIAVVYEDETPFARTTGTCTVEDGNIVCLRTKAVAVEGVVMTDALRRALGEKSAKDGKIALTVTDRGGRKFPIVVSTKFAY
jgi:hypothetical protein